MAIQFLRGTAEQRLASTQVLKIGQPFYETDTGKQYIGDGITELKNLKDVCDGLALQTDVNEQLQTAINTEKSAREEFDNAHNNIENGEGLGSIKSSNLNDDDRPYTEEELPRVTGHEAFGFGKKIIASGKRSFAMGNTVEVTGNTGFGFGQQLKVTGARAVSFGYDSENSGVTGFTAGQGLKNRSQNCAIFGQFNEFDALNIAETRIFEIGTGTGENNRRSSLVVQRDGSVLAYHKGKDTILDSEYQVVRLKEIRELNIKGGEGVGSVKSSSTSNYDGTPYDTDEKKIEATGHESFAFGRGCKATGTRSFAFGSYNISGGNSSYVIGQNNTATEKANRGFVGGYKNVIDNNTTFAFGQGLINSRERKATFGQWNYDEYDTLLEVGCGTSDNDRHNAFEVRTNGLTIMHNRAKVYGAPQDDTDVARKKELTLLENKIEDKLKNSYVCNFTTYPRILTQYVAFVWSNLSTYGNYEMTHSRIVQEDASLNSLYPNIPLNTDVSLYVDEDKLSIRPGQECLTGTTSAACTFGAGIMGSAVAGIFGTQSDGAIEVEIDMLVTITNNNFVERGEYWRQSDSYSFTHNVNSIKITLSNNSQITVGSIISKDDPAFNKVLQYLSIGGFSIESVEYPNDNESFRQNPMFVDIVNEYKKYTIYPEYSF